MKKPAKHNEISPIEVVRLRFADEYRRRFKPTAKLPWQSLALLALTPAAAKTDFGAKLLDAYADAPETTCHFIKWMRDRARKPTAESKVLQWLANPQNACDLRKKLGRSNNYQLRQKEIADDTGSDVQTVQNALSWLRTYIKKKHPSLVVSMSDSE